MSLATRIFSLLRSLRDVLISDPQDGQVLRYEAASEKWKNVTPPADFNPHSPGPIGDVTPGTGAFTTLSTSLDFRLGADVSLIPISGSQSSVATYWALQLGGNTQVNAVNYSPTAIGAADAASVIIRASSAPISLAVANSANTALAWWVNSDGSMGVAANTLALRNGTAGQTFILSRSYTDASNYSQVKLVCTGSTLDFVVDEAGTGVGTVTGISFNKPVQINATLEVNAGYGAVAINGASGVNINSAGFGITFFRGAYNGNTFIGSATGLYQFNGESSSDPALRVLPGAFEVRLADNSGTGTVIAKLPTSNLGPGILWNNAGVPAIGT